MKTIINKIPEFCLLNLLTSPLNLLTSPLVLLPSALALYTLKLN